MTHEPLYLGVTATAERYGLSRGTVNNLRRKGVLEWRTLANKVLIRLSSMEALLERSTPKQAPNLQRGTDLSHERSIRRKRIKTARERARRA
jgi:hypothetical protein